MQVNWSYLALKIFHSQWRQHLVLSSHLSPFQAGQWLLPKCLLWLSVNINIFSDQHLSLNLYRLLLSTCCVYQCPDQHWAIQPPIQRVLGFLPESTAARCEVDHSCPSSTEFKNSCSYNSAPPTRLHDINRDNLTITFSYIFTLLIHISVNTTI